jgi:putative transposase
MSRSATPRSVRRAGRMIKRMMNFVPAGWESVEGLGRKALGSMVEESMRRHVGERLNRSLAAGEVDRRNGSFPRRLLTGLGEIELSIPRTRRFSAVGLITAFARRTRIVDQSILASFVLGLSTRKVGEVLLRSLGVSVSAATVSRVARVLDAEVTAFHQRPLSHRYSVLQFDGVILSRRTGAGALRRPVLVVLGIRPDRRKEVIDFLLAPAESQAAWEGFLNDLYRRGLTAEGVGLITVDGGPGLIAALQTVYPRIPVQRCWAHKVRNVLDGIRLGDREAVKKDLRRIYQARSRLVACQQVMRFGHRWHQRYPKAVRQITRDVEELLNFFVFNDPDWCRLVRTTNAIERRFREVRRRTRPMGVFSDRTSIERILYAVFSYENRNQGTGRPFLVLTQNM